MNDPIPWQDSIRQVVATFWGDIVRNAPSLAIALLILIAGWLAARLTRAAVRRLANAANGLLDRTFRYGAMASVRFSPGAMAVLGELAFWLVVLVALTLAARVAGFAALTAWIGLIGIYLPDLLIGAGLIVIGYVLSSLVGEQVTTTARAAKVTQSALFGRLAQFAVFLTALVIGLNQMGVDVTILIALFVVIAGAGFAGFSIAFGLGARDFVSNLIGARTARRELIMGHTIRIGEIEGQLLEVTGTHIALDTAEGRTLVPSRQIDLVSVVMATPDFEGGGSDGQ